MANKVQIRRGNFANLPVLSNGEPGLAEDVGKVYIGNGGSNLGIQMAPGTADYTIYVATTALGGLSQATQGATGLLLASGTTTATTANKLVDSTAAFTAALVNKTVYNATADAWAKVTAVDSPTTLSLSADIFLTAQSYKVASAIDNIPEAFSTADSGFRANITIRVSPGTFADNITLIGKTAGDNKTLTLQGATTGTTTISGKVTARQKITFSNLTFTNWIKAYFGADLTWNSCVTSGASRLYHYDGNANTFNSSTVVFGNDPGTYSSVGSTITKGYTMYVASGTLGGDDAVADGLAIKSGAATSTAANKLVDSTANFNATDHLYKPLYNSTDDTWAKITAIDSTTQVSISADIMASGEAYVISNAFATAQSAVDVIPGSVNCDTTIKVSGETFSQPVLLKGKALTGSYGIKFLGTWSKVLSGGTVSSSTAGSATANATLTKTAAGWVTDAYKGALLKFDDNTSTVALRGLLFTVKSNTTDTLTIVGAWVNGFGTSPSASDTYVIVRPGTVISQQVKSEAAQKSLIYERLKMYIPGATGTASCYAADNSGVTLNYCETSRIWADAAVATLQNCYLHGNADRQLYATSGSAVTFRRCLITGDDAAGYAGTKQGIDAAASAQCGAGSDTSVVRNFVTGIKYRGNATGGMYLDTTQKTKSQIENNTTGVQAEEGGQATYIGTSYVIYSGNTTNQNAVSASYGYIA